MSEEQVIVLVVLGLLAVPVFVLVADGVGHPFTALGRAKWARARRISARKAELIARGFDDRSAKHMAENEVREDALKTTKMLQDAGVEP